MRDQPGNSHTAAANRDLILVLTDGSYVNEVIVPESDHTAAAAPQPPHEMGIDIPRDCDDL